MRCRCLEETVKSPGKRHRITIQTAFSFAIEGKPDAVETIANAYVKLGRHREGVVGFAQCYLFDAQDIVTFGVTYLEKHFGTTPIVPPHEAVERSCEPSG